MTIQGKRKATQAQMQYAATKRLPQKQALLEKSLEKKILKNKMDKIVTTTPTTNYQPVVAILARDHGYQTNCCFFTQRNTYKNKGHIG